MSSYGGENGFYYGNHYLTMCMEPQSLGVDSTLNNSGVITKRDEGNLNAHSTHFQEKRSSTDPCIVSLSSATKTVQHEEKVDKIEPMPPVEKEEDNAQPELDIIVNNVVCTFNVRCHLNLRQIALTGANVEYRREIGMVTMKLRKPTVTASIWSSGKVICTGATSDGDAKIAARKIARSLQHLGFRVRFTNYKVVNVLCTCYMYFGINLNKFTEKHRRLTCYEPELHPGATYKIKELKATLKLFTTGSITITAPSTENAQKAVEHIFPLVYEFKTPKPPGKQGALKGPLPVKNSPAPSICDTYTSSDEENEFLDFPDSDGSFD